MFFDLFYSKLGIQPNSPKTSLSLMIAEYSGILVPLTSVSTYGSTNFLGVCAIPCFTLLGLSKNSYVSK